MLELAAITGIAPQALFDADAADLLTLQEIIKELSP